MKRFSKTTSAVLVAVSILLLAVAATVFAAGVIESITPDETGVQTIMKSITGEEVLSSGAALMADYNNDDAVDVLDVIALKRFMLDAKDYNDGWTVGIY